MRSVVLGALIFMFALFPAKAETICVILDNNVVTLQVSCADVTNPPSVSIDTTDARWLSFLLNNIKQVKLTALDGQLDSNFDLKMFIRAGSATNVTAANVGAFLATITNNYRTLRASIVACANATCVNAVNILAGWPANP